MIWVEEWVFRVYISGLDHGGRIFDDIQCEIRVHGVNERDGRRGAKLSKKNYF